MPQVVDYSWGRVGGNDTNHAAAVKAAGYVGAVRYLCYPGDDIMRVVRMTLTPDDRLKLKLAPWDGGAT